MQSDLKRNALNVNAISPAERLIVPLDFSNADEAMRLVDRIEKTVSFYKVGLELFVAAGPSVVHRLQKRGHRVFLDLKMDDIVETITRAVRQVSALGVQFLTILGGAATADAAVAGRGEGPEPRILSVTLVTSLGESDLVELGLMGREGAKFASVDEYVAWRAAQALEHGCDGLITSGQNVRVLRETFCERHPLLICPGIRPSGVGHHDHKRASTPADAIRNGADFLVVGRPIRDVQDPPEAAKRIIGEIERGLIERGE